MRFFKIIRWFEKTFKADYITLRKCNSFNCDFNHAEACFLREDIDRLNYCEKLMSKQIYKEKELTNN